MLSSVKFKSRQNIFKLYLNKIMNQEYHFQKLADIKSAMPNSQREFSSIGIIIDCTNPHRKDAKKDYCMRLKIIDPITPDIHCSVFLYTKSLEDFPKKIRVGDILILNKFGFQIWNDGFQAKKHFKVPGSFFRFASGDPSADSYAYIDSSVGQEDSEGKILNQLKALRKNSHKFFKEHSVPLYSRNDKQSSDFDIILKVLSSEKKEANFYKIQMTNNINEFEINYCDDVAVGVYKIRSVADFSWKEKKCILLGNDYTCFIQIPAWMKTHDNTKQWDKIQPTKASTDARVQSDKLTTKIVNSGGTKADNRKIYSLKDLTNKDTHEQQVRVICQFVEAFTPFERALKKYDAKNNTEKSYDSQEGEYIYNAHFVITDDSMEGELFNVYIYSFDQKGNEFLNGLDPKKIFGKNTLAYKERYDHLVNRLLQQSDFRNMPLEIVLSPLYNGRDTIYRIVDTELII